VNSRQAFLLIAPADSARLPLVVNLAGALRAEPRRFVTRGLDPEQVRLFINSHATWLEVLQTP